MIWLPPRSSESARSPRTRAVAAIKNADLLIDVREADEFAAGHIPGAIHISRGMLEFSSAMRPSFSRDLDIVLYCKTSGRAALAANALAEMGYVRVQSIGGGFDAWLCGGQACRQAGVA